MQLNEVEIEKYRFRAAKSLELWQKTKTPVPWAMVEA